jgi:hypothetical protein
MCDIQSTLHTSIEVGKLENGCGQPHSATQHVFFLPSHDSSHSSNAPFTPGRSLLPPSPWGEFGCDFGRCPPVVHRVGGAGDISYCAEDGGVPCGGVRAPRPQARQRDVAAPHQPLDCHRLWLRGASEVSGSALSLQLPVYILILNLTQMLIMNLSSSLNPTWISEVHVPDSFGGYRAESGFRSPSVTARWQVIPETSHAGGCRPSATRCGTPHQR